MILAGGGLLQDAPLELGCERAAPTPIQDFIGDHFGTFNCWYGRLWHFDSPTALLMGTLQMFQTKSCLRGAWHGGQPAR
ncbi:MAG: hypothetical protein H0T88_05150 [Lysobacter sp.]|nr:hypothetical protein [Lysobacter sp.]